MTIDPGCYRPALYSQSKPVPHGLSLQVLHRSIPNPRVFAKNTLVSRIFGAGSGTISIIRYGYIRKITGVYPTGLSPFALLSRGRANPTRTSTYPTVDPEVPPAWLVIQDPMTRQDSGEPQPKNKSTTV